MEVIIAIIKVSFSDVQTLVMTPALGGRSDSITSARRGGEALNFSDLS
jgi:hypothetical protein